MKRSRLISLILLFQLILLAGCAAESSTSTGVIVTSTQPASPSPSLLNTAIKTIDPPANGNSKPQTSPAVPGITCQAVKAKLEKGNSFLLLDVRNKAEFNSEHIDTAVSIPIIDFPNQVGTLSPNLEIVVYSECS